MKKRVKSRAFSLVELVIVVVILGVIAAIAVPRISRGAKGAGDSALKGSLAGMRNAIDMFAAEHGGDFPGGCATCLGTQDEIVEQLTVKTDVFGKVNVDPTKNIYGPYLRRGLPPLSIGANKGSTDLLIDPALFQPNEAGGEGWVYATTTGEIIGNSVDNDDAGDPYSGY